MIKCIYKEYSSNYIYLVLASSPASRLGGLHHWLQPDHLAGSTHLHVSNGAAQLASLVASPLPHLTGDSVFESERLTVGSRGPLPPQHPHHARRHDLMGRGDTTMTNWVAMNTYDDKHLWQPNARIRASNGRIQMSLSLVTWSPYHALRHDFRGWTLRR
jgi:hypothetical protein